MDQTAEQEVCPKCGSKELHVGYGFAAGGLGAYVMCMDCDAVIHSEQDTDASEPMLPKK